MYRLDMTTDDDDCRYRRSSSSVVVSHSPWPGGLSPLGGGAGHSSPFVYAGAGPWSLVVHGVH